MLAWALLGGAQPSRALSAIEGPELPPAAATEEPSADTSGATQTEVPRYRGTGWFVGGGVVSGAALTLSAIAAVDRCTHYEDCLLFAPAFSNFAALTSTGALPFVVTGGVKRARYDMAVGASPPGRGLAIVGGILLGAGVASSAVLRTYNSRRPCDTEAYACHERWNKATSLGAWGSEAIATAGAGMLSYGITVRRGLKLSVRPDVSSSSWGLSLSGVW